MNRIIITTCIIIFFHATAAISSDSPVLQLVQGTQTITLTLVNDWSGGVSDLQATVDDATLPSWLSIQVQDTPIVLSPTDGRGQFAVKFNLDEPPLDARIEVPFLFSDGTGNQWRKTVVVSTSAAPEAVNALHDNFPNPFNPTTTIAFSLAHESNVKLVIYNMLGQRIRTLVNGKHAPGSHSVVWNGRDDQGRMVSSGVYFYRLQAGRFIETRRMVLVE